MSKTSRCQGCWLEEEVPHATKSPTTGYMSVLLSTDIGVRCRFVVASSVRPCRAVPTARGSKIFPCDSAIFKVIATVVDSTAVPAPCTVDRFSVMVRRCHLLSTEGPSVQLVRVGLNVFTTPRRSC
jgi:hypothetical protein